MPTEIYNADQGILIGHAAAKFCGIPGVGLTEEPVEVSEISSEYLLKDHCLGILVLDLSVKLMGVQYSTNL